MCNINKKIKTLRINQKKMPGKKTQISKVNVFEMLIHSLGMAENESVS